MEPAKAKIGGRARDVLRALVARCGDTVTKTELLNAAWPGLVVAENNIAVQITALRKALGHGAIASVAGIGYRLDPRASDAARAIVVGPGDATGSSPLARSAFVEPELFGRETDIDAVVDGLRRQMLVTIVGSGGVGKTALARAAIARYAREAGHAVRWVDLAPLRDASRLVPVVAQTIDVEIDSAKDAFAQIASALAQDEFVIALDNCEHVRAGVSSMVLQLSTRAPLVRWLATSRERLGIPSEVVHRLRPLEVPEPTVAREIALRFAALELLVRRATDADHRFALDDRDVATAIDLCAKLDGLPLAIEMAAARIATLGLDEVVRQLDNRLRLQMKSDATTPQHHSLRGLYDWSHELLSDDERTVFRRLAPFVGGFDVEMAQRIATTEGGGFDEPIGEWRALEAFSALVDKSLVQKSTASPPRFTLLESARDYAGEKLREAGEVELLSRRHAEVVAKRFETARSDSECLPDSEWIRRYVVERHNVRAALVWSISAREPDLLAQHVAALAQIDSFVYGPAEVVHFDVPLEVLLAAAPAACAPACLYLSWAHFSDGSRQVGTALARRALEDFTKLRDAAGVYRAMAQLIRLCEARPSTLDEARDLWARLQELDPNALPLRTRLFCAMRAGLRYDRPRTIERFDALVTLANEAGFDNLAAAGRVDQTDLLLIDGRFDDVVETAAHHLRNDEFRPRIVGLLALNQCLALVRLGRYRDALASARVALRALPGAAHAVVATLALAATFEGRLDDAARLYGYGDRIRRERDVRPDPAEARAVADTVDRLRTGLRHDRFVALMEEGARLSESQALKIALRERAPDAKVASPSVRSGPSS